MVGVSSIMPVPMFDRAASPFANYEEQVALWNQISTLGLQKRAANLLPNISDVALKRRCGRRGRGCADFDDIT